MQRVYSPFKTLIGKRVGYFNTGCFVLGLYAGFIMRDEMYYPTLKRTDDIVEHFEKCNERIENDISIVEERLSVLREKRRKEKLKKGKLVMKKKRKKVNN